MKLFSCKPFETSDDEEEEEEEVSEEEQQEESNADEDAEESAALNEEDDAPDDADEEDEEEEEIDTADTPAMPKSNEVKLNGKSSSEDKNALKTNGKSNGSLNSDPEDLLKLSNGKLDTEIVKKEDNEGQAIYSGAKPLTNTKSTISVPARLKNVSTETMVLTAIRTLNERGGSSAIAIKKYITNNYPQLDGPRMLMQIKKYIRKALLDGKLVQSKGTNVGGSFKVSAELNRLEEKREREKRKKLMQKSKKDAATGKADKKTKPLTKAKTKKSDTGEKKKTTTTKKLSKTKATKTAIKLDNGAETATNKKVPKTNAVLKKVPKSTDLKQSTKKATTKDAKTTPMDNGKSAEKVQMPKQGKGAKGAGSVMNMTVVDKQKKGSPVKSVSVAEVAASPIKAAPKAKSTPLPKKKPAVKGKPAVPDIDEITEIGAGDADTVKPAAKKAVGRKGKAK